MSPQQYAAYPRWRRALERFYRGGAGFWLYYMIELWWKRLYFPSRKYAPVRRRVFTRDSLLVSAFAIAHVAFVIWIAVYFDRTLLAALCRRPAAVRVLAYVCRLCYLLPAHASGHFLVWE